MLLCGCEMSGLYAPSGLLRCRFRSDVPGDDQHRHVHRCYARYRSDPALLQLRRFFRRDYFRHAGACVRRPCPTAKPKPRAICAALLGIKFQTKCLLCFFTGGIFIAFNCPGQSWQQGLPLPSFEFAFVKPLHP